MAAHTDLSLLKAQLNIDHDLDDVLLAHKLETAEWWITNHIGAHIAWNPDNPVLIEAALQLAAYWYEQREAASFSVTTAPIPFGVRDLLRSYRDEVTGHVA